MYAKAVLETRERSQYVNGSKIELALTPVHKVRRHISFLLQIFYFHLQRVLPSLCMMNRIP